MFPHSQNINLRNGTVLDPLIKWKPYWLYQVMPFIYLIAGVAALVYVDTPLGYAAGALLILTACLNWMKRKQTRL